jgi:hypothetical protein
MSIDLITCAKADTRRRRERTKRSEAQRLLRLQRLDQQPLTSYAAALQDYRIPRVAEWQPCPIAQAGAFLYFSITTATDMTCEQPRFLLKPSAFYLPIRLG